jgi:hydrophobic/amphiphilic exporter-1 (mainly G- bacteria), HAE1 family
MFSKIFIKRPVLAIVAAIITLLIGLISLPTLPIEQYPSISPPQVVVKANYTGASAQVVEETVTSILERQINGIPGMRYMTSTSSNDGSSVITVTFQQGYNQDIAAVDVQNRVALAEPLLPEVVRQTGVSVTKQISAIAVSFGLYSDRYDNLFLSNYSDLHILDSIRRIPGVGAILPFGERRYAMRIWLDPNQLASRNLTAENVVESLQEQNFQVGIGRIGNPPTVAGQQYQVDLQAVGRLREVPEFENLILKAETDGTIVRLKDVGRVELGAESYLSFARWNGKESIGYDVLQLPGSNTLEIARAVREEITRLQKNLPPDVKCEIAYDPSLFIIASRNEVIRTLIEAILLVVLIVFIFLQDWRTALIPIITIPITLVGTFAFVKAFHFSLNSLTLFALILATGLVVDDAIVVVEDIARRIKDEQLSPARVAIASMQELTGAVIASSLVLIAVFVPVAFFPGVTGQLYKQFALTIAFAIIISTFLALTLTPALSAMLLRQGQEPTGWLGQMFQRINRCLNWMQRGYGRSLHWLTRYKMIVVGLFIALLGLTGWLYQSIPTAFIPDEDQGYIISIIQAPEGQSQDVMEGIIDQIDQEVLKIPEVTLAYSLGGAGFSGNIANSGISYIVFKPWGDRTKPEQAAQTLLARIQESLSKITDVSVFSLNPPAIPGLGTVGGFVFQLQDRGNNDLNTFLQVKDELVKRASQMPELRDVFSTFNANAPQMTIEVDRDRAKALQVDVDDILKTLQTFIGSRYVNDFNAFGRTYRVYVQADKQFRSNPKDIEELYVRSAQGEMVSIGNLVNITSTTGPQTINHYNLFRSIEINGMAAPGYSSGQAIAAMERLAADVLPRTMGFEWSGISLEEITSGGQAPLIFGMGLLFVILVLAAQYNNFVDPLIIILPVPLAILGALVAQSWRGLVNDIYCQVGLVMLIGLASKNAILIVEFANQLRSEGLPITKAAIEASQTRFRPILMTALSTMLGVFPMMLATGAGSISRQSLGTAVFGGMLVATVLSLFVVPVLYIVIGNIRVQLNIHSYLEVDEELNSINLTLLKNDEN